MTRFPCLKGVLLVLGVLLPVSGCVMPRSYVDPTYGKVGYDDLMRRAEPVQWRIVAEFQRNGTHIPKADEILQGKVELVVRASGVAIPSKDAAAPMLKVTVNNVVDVGAAAAKGFGTGLTFGLVGSLVTDFYEMEAVLTDGTKEIRKSGYRHALHSTVGNASAPPNLSPTTPSEGFAKIVEQLMLNAMKDLEPEIVPTGRISEAAPSDWPAWRLFLGNLVAEGPA